MGKTISGFPINEFNGIKVNTSLLSDNRNYYSYSNRNVKYIVIHYTGNSSDTAKANANYFNSGSRGASAHYFVDNHNCYQSVALNNAAWAVGGTKSYKHSDCRNLNSVSIEMCTSGNYTVSEQTEINAAHLCAELCNLLGITADKVDAYVLRHYDVWAKDCPHGWTGNNNNRWNSFKNRIKNILGNNSDESAKSLYDTYLSKLVSKGIISDKNLWSEYAAPVTKAQAVALIDKATGGTWASDEADSSIHWSQPLVISLCGKGIISDKIQWIVNPDASISIALLLALVDNATGGMKAAYVGRQADHWGRNCLDSLCDKAIITTPSAWTNFEGEVNRGNTMALICKAFKI